MLQRLNHLAVECLAHAAELEERALESLHPQTKSDFLDMARRWRKLAESCQFVERVEDFLDAHLRIETFDRPDHPQWTDARRIAEELRSKMMSRDGQVLHKGPYLFK